MDDGFHDVAYRLPGGVALRGGARLRVRRLLGRGRRSVELSRVPLDGSNIAITAARLLAAKTGYAAVRTSRSRSMFVTGGMGAGRRMRGHV